MPRKQPPQPSVDNWYKTVNGDIFEVVAIDPQGDAIEIQYLDGALEELDEDTWQNLAPKVIDPPHEALSEAYDGEEGSVADYHDVVDLERGDIEWSGSFDDFE